MCELEQHGTKMQKLSSGPRVRAGARTRTHTHTEAPVEGGEQAAGGQHQGAAGQDRALVVDPVQVAAGHVGHADGAGGAVQELVAIPGRERVLFSPCALAKGGKMRFSF